jgi:catechol 2,3-dioxygenase-like lactoylglutathione lyase family enzyme
MVANELPERPVVTQTSAVSEGFSPAPAAPPAVTSIHHISLTATNLERSVAWYSDLLGLTKIMDEPHEGGRAVVLMQPQAGLFIGLHAHDANAGERFVETRTGLDHVSLGVPNREVLVAWQQRLAERGVVHSPIADVSYGSVLVLRDPDNIQLEFIAPAQG